MNQAWRSPLSHTLTSVERFGEYHLLTNPATNSIGCYPLVLRVAAAEAGMSSDELQNVLSRLQEMEVAIYRDGFVLVRTWFFHSTWESTLQGNVLKTALSDIRRIPASLRTPWRDACLLADVPVAVVDEALAKALGSPFQGASEGLPHTTPTDTKTELETTTTTVVGTSLDLLPCAEPYRQMLAAIASEHSLVHEQVQELAWELAARLDAANRGAGPAIGHVDRWLQTLIAKQAAGASILQAGRSLEQTARWKRQTQQESQRDREEAARVQAAAEEQNRQAEAILQVIDEAVLSSLIDQLPGIAPSPKHVARCKAALLARTVPPGLEGALIRRLLHRAELVGSEQSEFTNAGSGRSTDLPPAPPQ